MTRVVAPDLAVAVELQPREGVTDLSAEASRGQLLGHVLDRSPRALTRWEGSFSL